MNSLRRLAAAPCCCWSPPPRASRRARPAPSRARSPTSRVWPCPAPTLPPSRPPRASPARPSPTRIGVFRIAGLPVGTYDVKVDLTGFATTTRKVGRERRPPPPRRKCGSRSRARPRRSRSWPRPRSSTRTPRGVGEIITEAQIENLPLNGRQFGNLAALVPGVSLGFHTDPTKSTQFAPQVAAAAAATSTT